MIYSETHVENSAAIFVGLKPDFSPVRCFANLNEPLNLFLIRTT